MTRIDAVQHRLQQASDLAAVLDAAYEAFEGMLSVIHPVQDPASGLFAALVMAAASAANGRNALALAPSLPGHPLLAVPAEQRPWSGEPPERVAEVVAGLSHLVAERLAQAAACAAGHRRPGRLQARRPKRPGHLRTAQQQAMTARPAFGDFLTAARDHASVAAARHQTDRGGEQRSGSYRQPAARDHRHGPLPAGHRRGAGRHAVPRQPAADRMGPRPPHRAGRAHPRRPAPAATHRGHASTGRDRPQRACPPTRCGGGSADRRAGPAAHPPGPRSARRPAVPVRMGPGRLFPAGRAGAAGRTGLARPPDRRPLHRPCPVLPGPRTPPTRERGLRGACGWLQVLSTSVQAAQRTDPVSADDRDLLLAIPLNAPLPRPILDGSEPVASLYDAVITSAERARHAAWVTGTQPAWSPHLTADSLRQVAATSTVTSHHCEILLRSLAARTAGSDTAGLSARLLRAADAAGRARTGWLHVARALNQVDTDTMRHLAPTAGEAGDLALCTGRLAYADAAWTLSSGPGHQPRPPHELAPHPGDVPLALAAAHHACDAVTSLAYAQRERIRTAASAGRLLVPTRSLPDTMDIPRPFAPALPGHVHALLRLCQDTAEAAAEASAQAGEAAAAIRAPSHLLTAARAAAHAGRDASTSPPHPAAPEPAVAGQPS